MQTPTSFASSFGAACRAPAFAALVCLLVGSMILGLRSPKPETCYLGILWYPIMENQMEKKMENEMETGGYIGVILGI